MDTEASQWWSAWMASMRSDECPDQGHKQISKRLRGSHNLLAKVTNLHQPMHRDRETHWLAIIAFLTVSCLSV
jgi:hypothetical protein